MTLNGAMDPPRASARLVELSPRRRATWPRLLIFAMLVPVLAVVACPPIVRLALGHPGAS